VPLATKNKANIQPKGEIMKKLVMMCLAVGLLGVGLAMAQDSTTQDTMKQGTTKQDTMKADKTSGKSMNVTGKISEDGKTIVSDKDGKSWTISNPDAVKGHEGHHVVVKGHADAATNEIKVASLKMAKEGASKKDTMQKDEMKK